jgi:hypothetical protein
MVNIKLNELRKTILESPFVNTNLPVLGKEREFKKLLPLVTVGFIVASNMCGCHGKTEIDYINEKGEKEHREVKCGNWTWQFEYYTVDENYEIIIEKNFYFFPEGELDDKKRDFTFWVKNIPTDDNLTAKTFKKRVCCSNKELENEIKKLIQTNAENCVEGQMIIYFLHEVNGRYITTKRSYLACVLKKQEGEGINDPDFIKNLIIWNVIWWGAID